MSPHPEPPPAPHPTFQSPKLLKELPGPHSNFPSATYTTRGDGCFYDKEHLVLGHLQLFPHSILRSVILSAGIFPY